LVYLGLTVIPLQVDLFLNALLSEDVMTAAYTLIESEAPQYPPQIVKGDIRVRSAAQYSK
jgi:hypothetical protein